jgi:hypothetical protein
MELTTRIARKMARAAMTAGQWLTVTVLTTLVLGCNLLDKGLEATAPDKIETSVLEVPANAGLIVNSAIGNFECALKAYSRPIAPGAGSHSVVPARRSVSTRVPSTEP